MEHLRDAIPAIIVCGSNGADEAVLHSLRTDYVLKEDPLQLINALRRTAPPRCSANRGSPASTRPCRD